MDNPKLKKLKELLVLASEGLTRDEFIAAFKAILEHVKKVEGELKTTIDSKLKDADSEIKDAAEIVKKTREELNQIVSETREANETTLSSLRKRAIEAMESLFAKMRVNEKLAEVESRFEEVAITYAGRIADLDDRIATVPEAEEIISRALDMIPEKEETGEEIVDKINALSTDPENQIDASHIKNLPKTESGRIIGGHGPLWQLQDVDVAGILPGQSLQWDGVRWIAFTPAGSGGTPVWGEDLTPQGPGTAFTLAHTPLAGTVRLFRGGAYQSVANGDYSIAGATITVSPTLLSGEVLVADYSY